jgi:large subunit ribosomal protein L32
MAVQKSKKSPSKRGMRRAHNALANPTISEDQETGELHLRHHMTKDGFYRGKQIIAQDVEVIEEE